MRKNERNVFPHCHHSSLHINWKQLLIIKTASELLCVIIRMYLQITTRVKEDEEGMDKKTFNCRSDDLLFVILCCVYSSVLSIFSIRISILRWFHITSHIIVINKYHNKYFVVVLLASFSFYREIYYVSWILNYGMDFSLLLCVLLQMGLL